MRFEQFRLLKEKFRSDGEKFGRVRCTIFIENCVAIIFNIIAKLLIFFLQYACPGAVGGRMLKDGRVVTLAESGVNLMSKFVKDDIMGTTAIAGGALDVVPREDDGAAMPGFAEPDLRTFGDNSGCEMLNTVSDVGVGINKDRMQAGVIVSLAMEQKNAGIGGDGEFYFIGDFQAAAAFETLFG